MVAEGVEDETTLTVLSALGCDNVQGYLIARPGALADFALLCRTSERGAAKILPRLTELSPQLG